MVPVSVGELVDKVTILRIKSKSISDSKKLDNIRRELEALTAVCVKNGIDLGHDLVSQLHEVNQKLWVIEDDIRDQERHQTFGQEFISLARQVYIVNDERFRLKSELNKHFGSQFHEEKSYQPYR